MSPQTAVLEPQEVQALSSPEKGNGRRLTQRETAILLQLSEAGKSGAEIAKVLKCSESTVSRQLDQWCDNRAIARKYLENQAPKLAKTIVKSKDAATALKALGKLDVVREDVSASSSQVVVMIGNQANPLEPPIIELSPLSRALPGESTQNQA